MAFDQFDRFAAELGCLTEKGMQRRHHGVEIPHALQPHCPECGGHMHVSYMRVWRDSLDDIFVDWYCLRDDCSGAVPVGRYKRYSGDPDPYFDLWLSELASDRTAYLPWQEADGGGGGEETTKPGI